MLSGIGQQTPPNIFQHRGARHAWAQMAQAGFVLLDKAGVRGAGLDEFAACTSTEATTRALPDGRFRSPD